MSSPLLALLMEKIFEAMNTLSSFEKRQLIELHGEKYHSAEIHLLLVVEHNRINLTNIAKKLHITKGAASQTITRLEKKGILLKQPNPQNLNELEITFTQDGKRLVRKIKEFQTTLALQFFPLMTSYSEAEISIIIKFLIYIIKFMD